ncbi:AAA family ATPase [Nitrospinae bacterium AH_259_B05_G02_I21]|nr:AAA family ATPase [Nitrospinae bacterium AH_259_B05_G02_I21]
MGGKVVSIKEPQPYRNKEAERVREELISIMEEQGYSIVALAAHFDIARSTLQMFVSGTYSAPADLARKLKPALREARERIEARAEGAAATGELFATVALQMCHHALEFCYKEGELGVVAGPAGVGKTSAIRAYVNGRDDILLLEADATWGKFGAIKTLAEMVGLDPDRHSRVVLNSIVESLVLKPRFLIVDEADLISHPGLEVLRTIHDRCGGVVGLVLIGLPRLYQNMTRGRSGRANFAQLYSRVGIFAELPMPTLKEVRAFVRSKYPKATDDAIQALAAEGRELGMRRVAKLLKGAAEVAEMNDTDLNAEVVQVAATRTMMIA